MMSIRVIISKYYSPIIMGCWGYIKMLGLYKNVIIVE
jgi:hypothetical protein